MDDEGIGLIAWILIGVGAIIVLLGGAAGIMYATDTPIKATIIDKDCGSNPLGSDSVVTVRTKFPVPGIEAPIKDFDNKICTGLRTGDDGNYVEYHLKSEHTIFYEREGGSCLYDSESGIC